MSNLEQKPEEFLCRPHPETLDPKADRCPVEIITSRLVPLGGPRAMKVNRTLPQKKRSLIGAWCFADHYGPDDVSVTGGMDVAPHPHTGLQTVSWLFEGEIAHIDSGGNRGMVRPGEVNLMTAGGGICHSETTTDTVTTLHGVQLWVALPDSVRASTPRNFEHYRPEPVTFAGGSAIVFLGSLLGDTSPVATFSPLLGAEIRLESHASVRLEVDPSFEHGLLVDSGDVRLEGVRVEYAAIGYTGIGARYLHIDNVGDEPARMVLLGGTPFGEDIVMWWNFVGRDSGEIEIFRKEWQERTEIFGQVEGYVGHGGPNANIYGQSWLPAPELPKARIRARKNPEPVARPELPNPGDYTETVTITKEGFTRDEHIQG